MMQFVQKVISRISTFLSVSERSASALESIDAIENLNADVGHPDEFFACSRTLFFQLGDAFIPCSYSDSCLCIIVDEFARTHRRIL